MRNVNDTKYCVMTITFLLLFIIFHVLLNITIFRIYYFTNTIHLFSFYFELFYNMSFY